MMESLSLEVVKKRVDVALRGDGLGLDLMILVIFSSLYDSVILWSVHESQIFLLQSQTLGRGSSHSWFAPSKSYVLISSRWAEKYLLVCRLSSHRYMCTASCSGHRASLKELKQLLHSSASPSLPLHDPPQITVTAGRCEKPTLTHSIGFCCSSCSCDVTSALSPLKDFWGQIDFSLIWSPKRKIFLPTFLL